MLCCCIWLLLISEFLSSVWSVLRNRAGLGWLDSDTDLYLDVKLVADGLVYNFLAAVFIYIF